MSERSPSADPQSTARFAARAFAVLAALTFCLIVVGALVRANDAGLACPDWPLCHGQAVPEFDLKIAFEWGHRIFAGAISLGLVALSWLGLRDPVLRGVLRPRLIFAWVLLATQVVFGGLTVLLLLAPWTVSVHLVLGNAFFVTLVWISRDLSEMALGPAERPPLPSPATAALAGIVASCLVLQIVLGGMVSSHYAGLACTDFPTCDGASMAPTFQGLVGVHVLHRLNGFALFFAFALMAAATWRRGRCGTLGATGLALVTAQIGAGAANVLLGLPQVLTAVHTALAAAIVLVTALLVREVAGLRVALPGRPVAPGASASGTLHGVAVGVEMGSPAATRLGK